MDYFIIAGCSVLRPDATNGFAWGNTTLKQGILRGLCGYHDAAPADSDGAATIAQEFAQRVNSGSAPHRSGDLVLDAWLEVNRKHNVAGIAYYSAMLHLLEGEAPAEPLQRTGFWLTGRFALQSSKAKIHF
ncbi:MAG: hypothetical protein KatS3mg023_3109 [Armatimonadota bacterium]|nr:MAG: hypothetical protein KatS3mg023_3109 [Armatimonadota bacterium]